MSFDQLLILCLIAVLVSVAMAILAAVRAVRYYRFQRHPIEWPPTFDEILQDRSTHYWCR